MRISEEELSSQYESKYIEILDELNIIKPTFLPRVSEHIQEIQEIILRLIESGYAQKNGEDIIFNIEAIEEYGELSKQKLNQLKSSSNFCLWKKTTIGKTWDSPWGKGRPGWHTECFAFINKYLGLPIDIHGGGVDLKFPHHENENAHCRALHNSPLANIWIHIGHLSTDQGKISKSSNKQFLVKDLIKDYSPNLIRLIFFINHYSNPSLITHHKLKELHEEWKEFQAAINKAVSHIYINTKQLPKKYRCGISYEILEQFENDINLPQVLTILQTYKKNLLTSIKQKNVEQIQKWHATLHSTLIWLGFRIDDVHSAEHLQKLDLWNKLVNDKCWEQADKLRWELSRENLI